VITGARFVNIYVADQDRALAFYTQKLGFDVLTDAPMGEEMGGGRWIAVGPKGAQTHFVLYTPPGLEDRVGGLSNVVFASDDIRATAEDLESKGVEFTQEPSEQPWGWWAQFRDSEGNEFGLTQSR
jgi:predicted enzyme related to lactoylglutathione lyase